MPLEQGLHGGFHFVGLVDEVGPGAAALFACVGGQLDAVDGEHLAADQALCIADQKRLFEDLTDQVTQTADEGGDGGEVGAAVTAEGDEDDVAMLQALHKRSMPRLEITPRRVVNRASQQHDLEQHGGREGRRTGVVVVEACVEGAEVDLVVEQMAQRVLEGAGQ
jgi:hypothetical protein